MPRISNFEILNRNEQRTLSIFAETTVENLPTLIGESYRKLEEYLNEIGEYLADVPFVAYDNVGDMQNLEVEIGFPVREDLPEKGDIQSGCIFPGKVVFCMYRGPYSEMEPVYVEMNQWIVDNGHEPDGVVYEHYYNGLDFPESELLTMIVMTLE